MMTQVRNLATPPAPHALPRRVPATPREAARRLGDLDALVNPELFKALGDPTRARILACLCKCSRACAVSEIAACCSVDLSVVSRHLALLERAGLLDLSRQGRTAFYRVRYEMLVRSFRDLADAVEACWSACGDSDAGACGPGSCACSPGVELTTSGRASPPASPAAPAGARRTSRRSIPDAR